MSLRIILMSWVPVSSCHLLMTGKTMTRAVMLGREPVPAVIPTNFGMKFVRIWANYVRPMSSGRLFWEGNPPFSQFPFGLPGLPHFSGELNLCFWASTTFLSSKTHVRNSAQGLFCGAQTERKEFQISRFPKKLSKVEFEAKILLVLQIGNEGMIHNND